MSIRATKMILPAMVALKATEMILPPGQESCIISNIASYVTIAMSHAQPKLHWPSGLSCMYT